MTLLIPRAARVSVAGIPCPGRPFPDQWRERYRRKHTRRFGLLSPTFADMSFSATFTDRSDPG
jgi:hypothetical protein